MGAQTRPALERHTEAEARRSSARAPLRRRTGCFCLSELGQLAALQCVASRAVLGPYSVGEKIDSIAMESIRVAAGFAAVRETLRELTSQGSAGCIPWPLELSVSGLV